MVQTVILKRKEGKKVGSGLEESETYSEFFRINGFRYRRYFRNEQGEL
jgi:hypothetical protein